MNIPNNTRRLACRLSLASLLLALISLAGCSNDPIFSAIEDEVKLVDPTLRGTVTSMVLVDGDGDGDNDLFVANGYLYERVDGTGSWNKIALPEGAGRCTEVASDGTNLYGRFTAKDYVTFDSVQLYISGTWYPVSGPDDIVLIGSGNGRIYAFTGEDADYDAYVTPSAGSTAIGTTAIKTSISTPTGTAGNYVSTDACVYTCDGSSLTETGGTDASPSGVTGIAVATVGSTENLYAVNSGYAWRYANAAWTKLSHDLDSPTSGIAYLGGTKNLLLIASGSEDGGFSEVTLGTDGSLSDVIGTPGDSALSSVATGDQDQYESTIGQWALYRIFAITSPVPAGDSYVVYTSVIHYKYDGLWSYYSNTNTEWNRE